MSPTLPPAPLYPGHVDLYATDVYVTTLEGTDIYWGPVDDFGNPESAVLLVGSERAFAAWDPANGWVGNHTDIPESVKRFAESIYHLHA